MKRFIISTLAFLFAVVTISAFTGKDTPIAFSDLPRAAQQLIHKHFAGSKVALAKMEKELLGRSYEIIFTNGNKIEFDRNGKWTSLDCEYTQVPTALIPKPILQYVRNKYPRAKVIEIERNRKGYTVELNNHIDIKFNNNYKVVNIDY